MIRETRPRCMDQNARTIKVKTHFSNLSEREKYFYSFRNMPLMNIYIHTGLWPIANVLPMDYNVCNPISEMLLPCYIAKSPENLSARIHVSYYILRPGKIIIPFCSLDTTFF